jgi:hypothetical protein
LQLYVDGSMQGVSLRSRSAMHRQSVLCGDAVASQTLSALMRNEIGACEVPPIQIFRSSFSRNISGLEE